MFVKTLKTPLIAGILSSVVLLSAISGTANSSELADENPTIPVTVELSGVQLSDGPLYISVQTRDQFQGVKGYGTVVKKATPGAMSVTVNIGESGEYGIMVWHDLNDDGVFSMSDSYQILDGWGGSGTMPTHRRPNFDDARVSIGGGGASVPVKMMYPS